MDERRKFLRLDSPAIVRYKKVTRVVVKERTLGKNVGEGGIRIPTREKLSLGAALDLEITLPYDPMVVYAQGEVAWIREDRTDSSRPFDIGIRFSNISDYDRKRLHTYIAHQLKK